MKARFLITILIFTISQFSVSAIKQKITKSNYEIILRTNEGTIRTQVSGEKKRVCTKPGRFYYGYYLNSLYCKQGELQGKPLNGEFKRYDLKDNIIESGNFKYGVKDGLWKQLTPNGTLTETSEYLQGLPDGQRIIYKNGKPDLLERYRKGKLIGKPEYLNPLTAPKNGVDKNVKKKNLFHRLFKHKDFESQVKTKKTPEKTKTKNNPTNQTANDKPSKI